MSGSISAESAEAARNKLSNSGMSILNVTQQTVGIPQKRTEGLKVFEFEATNPEQKKISGTIEAVDEYEAYKKLRLEYEFEIAYVMPRGLPMAEKFSLKQRGIDPAFEERLKEEQKSAPKKKEEEEKKEPSAEEEIEAALFVHKKEIDFMHKKVDEALKDVKALLQKNDKYLNYQKKREIEERIDLLSRLRKSNSVEHLKNLTTKVMVQLTDDALFIEEAELKAEDREAWEASKSEFTKFGAGFTKSVDKGLASLQSLFSGVKIKVDTKSLKQSVSEIHPIKKFLSVLFFTFSSLFCLCAIFWAWIFLQKFSGFNIEYANFYLRSGIMWYTTAVSAIFVTFLAFGFASDKFDTLNKRLIFAGCGLATLLLITFEFPVLFFWT